MTNGFIPLDIRCCKKNNEYVIYLPTVVWDETHNGKKLSGHVLPVLADFFYRISTINSARFISSVREIRNVARAVGVAVRELLKGALVPPDVFLLKHRPK